MPLFIIAIAFHMSIAQLATCTEDLTSTRTCRTERRIYLPYEQFKVDACARCYMYMPTIAFKTKFRYDGVRLGMLVDPMSNVSHRADPQESKEEEDEDRGGLIADSFLDTNLTDKWKACCRAAHRCCDKMLDDPPLPSDNAGGINCPRTWDGWQCWSDTPAGIVASQPCPDHIYFETEPPHCTRYVTKKCLPSGTWYLKDNFREWTNYSKCGRRDEHQRHLHFHIATYAISIMAIIPALIIFTTYKQLQVPRISMHKNLFLSLLLNGLTMVLFKSAILARELDRLSTQQPSFLHTAGSGCKLLLILTRYFRSCNYAWMLCEGYYLHRLITAAFAERRSLLLFHAIGWGLPALPVSVYALIRATLENDNCWAFPVEQYEWVVNIPNLLSILANLFFLCDIIRVLVTKLRATHANEPSQFRKAVRATLVLVPLFGLHFCLVIYRAESRRCGIIEAYVYFRYAMDGLQGFMVALTFCYMNGEVLYLLKRSYQRYKLRLQIQGSIHSSAILRRLSTTQDSTMNDSQNHHHSHRTKYMENKLRELNNQMNIINDENGRQNNHAKV